MTDPAGVGTEIDGAEIYPLPLSTITYSPLKFSSTT